MKGRAHTILKAYQNHVDIRPMVDADKNYFLNELLKLMAFAEKYFRLHKFMELFNAGLAIAFFCI